MSDATIYNRSSSIQMLKNISSRNGSREFLGNSRESLDTASSDGRKKRGSQIIDGFEIPEEEIWCYNPSKTKYTKNPCYFRDWIREVFDSYDSPLYNIKGQIFHILGTAQDKKADFQEPNKPSVMTMSQSESVPSLNKIKESTTFDGKLTSHNSRGKLSSSRGHSHSPPIHLSGDEGDLCLLAKKQEDALKAQVAAMSYMRHTESQSSLKSNNPSPMGSKSSLNNIHSSIAKEKIPDRYINAMEDSESMLNRIRQPISTRQNTINIVGNHTNLSRSYNQPLRIDPNNKQYKHQSHY